MLSYEIEKSRGFGSTWVNVIGKNAKQETMTIELIHCENPGGKKSLPYLWWKAGYTDKIMETYLSVQTYVHDSENGCYGGYNPQSKLSEDRGRHVINFDWLLEDTEENEKKLIEECIKRFEAATGKSATELKMEKIYNYAKEKGMEIVTEIPDGWYKQRSMSTPWGSERIVNTRPFIKLNGKLMKNPDYKEKFLVL